MKRRDKHNMLLDPFETKEKSDKLKEQNKASMKKRLKGTGKIDRSFHLRKEDL